MGVQENLCYILNESKTTILRINSLRDKAAYAFLKTLFINNMNSMQIYYLHYVADYSDQHGYQYYWKTKKGDINKSRKKKTFLFVNRSVNI